LKDNLSEVHFKRVWSEIQGRFFSKEEAEMLKAVIERHTVTDPQIRAEAAKAWGKPN
jgi:hypothetical protein